MNSSTAKAARVWLVATWLVAAASPASALDLRALQQACTAAAAARLPERAAVLSEIALDEWGKFGRGKIRETSDDTLVMSSATESLLSWDKVYQYWVATRSEGSLRYPYAVRGGQRVSTSVTEEMAAVRSAFPADTERQARIFAALRRSGVGSTAWSAVFISTVFKLGGYSAEEFEGAAAHALYMRSALRAAEDGRPGYAQLPCDPTWVKPRMGDLVCFSRTSAVRSFADVISRHEQARAAGRADTFPFESHCDVVTFTPPGGASIDTVGGNFSDTVKKSDRPTRAGQLTSPPPEAAPGTGWLMVLLLTY